MIIEHVAHEYYLQLRFDDYPTAKHVLNMFENSKVDGIKLCSRCGILFDSTRQPGDKCRVCTEVHEIVKGLRKEDA